MNILLYKYAARRYLSLCKMYDELHTGTLPLPYVLHLRDRECPRIHTTRFHQFLLGVGQSTAASFECLNQQRTWIIWDYVQSQGGGLFLLRSTANSCTSREVSEAILSGHAPSCWSTLGHVGVSCWSPLSLWYLAVQNWWWLKSNREIEVPNCYIIMGNTNLNSGPSMWLPSLTPITFPPSRSEPSLSWECWEMSRYS